VTMLLAGVAASTIAPARLAFDRVPAELDLQQRGRTAIDALSQVLRSAVAITISHDTLIVLASVTNGARGVLAADQSGAALMLATSPCAGVRDACGFVPGATAIIADGAGRYDVFVVAAANAGVQMLTADHAFPHPYPAGSAIVAIDRYAYRLASQADGSLSLIRETSAGAIQPMVDFVRGWSFGIDGSRVELSLRVSATTPIRGQVTVADRVFRTSVQLRNVS
jgi:hypothetical protein